MKEKKDLNTFLGHVAESAETIEQYTKGMNHEQFLKMPHMQDAIVRRLEIMGEAVKNLPRSFINNHPYIAWDKIAGLRDVLIHQYFGVDVDLVWKIAKKDVPKLKKEITELLERLEK